jgi:hypothetical protein
LGLAAPEVLEQPYRLWQRAGEVLGAINSRIVLNLVFFLIFVPAGAVARVFGWDPLDRHFDRARSSYRQPSAIRPPDSIEKPY